MKIHLLGSGIRSLADPASHLTCAHHDVRCGWTFQRAGGLGGLEAIEIDDASIEEDRLRDLKALKAAERLTPGKYRVIFGPVVTGVLAHEAFGHSQEGDTCARSRSKAWDLHHTGESVGNEHATILNNPAIYENGADSYAAWGSYFFDEEGWLAHEQVILDKGRLGEPMTNLTSALRLGIPRTANGKRESWAHGVYTRQTNTYFSAGDKTFNELLAMLGDGYLALHPAGGWRIQGHRGSRSASRSSRKSEAASARARFLRALRAATSR